jgi:hypothetical protein
MVFLGTSRCIRLVNYSLPHKVYVATDLLVLWIMGQRIKLFF